MGMMERTLKLPFEVTQPIFKDRKTQTETIQ
jgi:hypothetical protein